MKTLKPTKPGLMTNPGKQCDKKIANPQGVRGFAIFEIAMDIRIF